VRRPKVVRSGARNGILRREYQSPHNYAKPCVGDPRSANRGEGNWRSPSRGQDNDGGTLTLRRSGWRGQRRALGLTRQTLARALNGNRRASAQEKRGLSPPQVEMLAAGFGTMGAGASRRRSLHWKAGRSALPLISPLTRAIVAFARMGRAAVCLGDARRKTDEGDENHSEDLTHESLRLLTDSYTGSARRWIIAAGKPRLAVQRVRGHGSCRKSIGISNK